MTIGKAILVLIIAGIILFVVVQVLNVGESVADREACKSQVYLRAQSKIAGKTIFDSLDSCQTNVVDIGQTDQEIVKEIIAGEMYDCWYEFEEGKKDFLSDWDFGKGDNWCFICSRINFMDNTREKIPSVENFDLYLKSEEIPEKGIHFFDYFYGKKTGSLVEPLPNGFDIPTNKTIYVAFFADKRLSGLNESDNVAKIGAISTVAGCISGFVLGAVTSFGIEAIPGCVVGAKVGLAIGSGLAITDVQEHKTEYLPGLYIGESGKIMDVCKQ